MKNNSTTRNEAVSYIKDFLHKLLTGSIYTNEIFCDDNPIIHNDPYSDANTYTLTGIILDKNGKLKLESASSYRDCADYEDELGTEILVDVAEWLKEHEDDFYEEYNVNGILATTAKGTKVCLCFVDDCEDNEGGFFVEVYEYPGTGDYFDYFCIHKEDCDCEDMNAVEEFARKYISEVNNY